MAEPRYRCTACGRRGIWIFFLERDGRRKCRCGSTDVVLDGGLPVANSPNSVVRALRAVSFDPPRPSGGHGPPPPTGIPRAVTPTTRRRWRHNRRVVWSLVFLGCATAGGILAAAGIHVEDEHGGWLKREPAGIGPGEHRRRLSPDRGRYRTRLALPRGRPSRLRTDLPRVPNRARAAPPGRGTAAPRRHAVERRGAGSGQMAAGPASGPGVASRSPCSDWCCGSGTNTTGEAATTGAEHEEANTDNEQGGSMTKTEHPIPIPATEWQQVHHRVVPFIDGDERRGHGMVLLTTHGGRRRWVGTDCARLVVLDGGCQESEVTALLSHRLICAAVQLGEPEGDDVELSIEPDGPGGRAACTVGAGPARVTLPGQRPVFPDWEAVAHDPHEVAATATVDRDSAPDVARRSPARPRRGGPRRPGAPVLARRRARRPAHRGDVAVLRAVDVRAVVPDQRPSPGTGQPAVLARTAQRRGRGRPAAHLRTGAVRPPRARRRGRLDGVPRTHRRERGGGPAEGRARHRRGLRHRAGARRGRRLPADGESGARLRPPDLRGAAPPAALRPRSDGALSMMRSCSRS